MPDSAELVRLIMKYPRDFENIFLEKADYYNLDSNHFKLFSVYTSQLCAENAFTQRVKEICK